MCANFKLKRTTLTFLAQICPKRKWGFEIQKTNVGIRISMLEMPYVPIFRQNEKLCIFGSKFAQKFILVSKFQKSKSGFGISILEILCAPIFRQNFGLKFAQKWILGSEFGINTSIIPCVPIFSEEGQLLIFRSKFEEIAQLCAIFWFKYCWGCCRQLDWDWNELSGGGWSWVEVGARFSNTLY